MTDDRMIADPRQAALDALAAAGHAAVCTEYDDDYCIIDHPLVATAQLDYLDAHPEAAAALRAYLNTTVTEQGGCGSLGWTVERWGRVTHKHSCPNRTDGWCQSHPAGCDLPGDDLGAEVRRLREALTDISFMLPGSIPLPMTEEEYLRAMVMRCVRTARAALVPSEESR